MWTSIVCSSLLLVLLWCDVAESKNLQEITWYCEHLANADDPNTETCARVLHWLTVLDSLVAQTYLMDGVLATVENRDKTVNDCAPRDPNTGVTLCFAGIRHVYDAHATSVALIDFIRTHLHSGRTLGLFLLEQESRVLRLEKWLVLLYKGQAARPGYRYVGPWVSMTTNRIVWETLAEETNWAYDPYTLYAPDRDVILKQLQVFVDHPMVTLWKREPVNNASCTC